MEDHFSSTGGAPSKLRDRQAYRSGAYLQAHIFLGVTVGLLVTFRWPLRWLLSGTPVLTYILWLGEGTSYRVQPFIPLWTLVILINLTYSIAATSWLLFSMYLPACYFTIVVASLYQFNLAARLLRSALGSVLEQPQFIHDKVAFFNIPALEIDTEGRGLMVVRGVTFSLLHLSLVAHGVEVGIKLSDDMELAIHVDNVKISLLRRIDIGDVYCNLKGGEYEMSFGNLAESKEVAGDSLMVTDTPLLVAAAMDGRTAHAEQVRRISTTDKLTDGSAPRDVSAEDGLASLTQISPDEEKARTKYANALRHIDHTSVILECKQKVDAMSDESPNIDSRAFNPSDKNDMRAAICTQLHDKPSVPHPPQRSIKVTTLRNLTSPYIRRFLHRLPFLLRLLLNPLAYFHPLHIESVTAGLSGKWLRHFLHDTVFKDYANQDVGIRKLETRIEAWLADANFIVEVANIMGLAQVPLSTAFDVSTQIKAGDVMAYRTLPQEVDLKQVVRLAGADASITVPSFLLPHHEHILPEKPEKEMKVQKEKDVAEADGAPKTIQAQQELEQIQKDETYLTLSVHARLPAVFDQELLDFIAALVKATKIIEMEHGNAAEKVADSVSEPESISESGNEKNKKRNIKEWSRAMGTTVRDGARRVAVDAVTNDRWIAKIVGKITRRLEYAKGDLGYSGTVPISLIPYRAAAEEAVKLLP
jgi:hypothetical protein